MADNADTAQQQLSDTADTDGEAANTTAAQRVRRRREFLLLAAFTVVALLGLTSWLGWQFDQSRNQQHQRDIYLQAARQGALNLTTIDFREADADIKRILDSSTGAFHDDFQQRSQPFIDTVKQAQSTSVGTVTAAGLELVTDHQSQALVLVSVKSSLAGVEQPQPRAWRMRLDIEMVGHEAKVSNVAFVA